MIEGVVDGFHQGIGGVEGVFQRENIFKQFVEELFGASFSGLKNFLGFFTFNLRLNGVELSVDVEDCYALSRSKLLSLVVSAPRVSIASDFGFGAVEKDLVKSIGSITLDKAAKVFQHQIVSSKGLIRRVVKYGEWVKGVANIWSHLAFANFVFVQAVLDFYFSVVGFDDVRFKDFSFEKLVEGLKSEGTSDYPVALSRARDSSLVAFEDFALAIVWQTVGKFVDDDGGKQARSAASAGYWGAWFFSSDYVLLAFWTGAHFLLMLKLDD